MSGGVLAVFDCVTDGATSEAVPSRFCVASGAFGAVTTSPSPVPPPVSVSSTRDLVASDVLSGRRVRCASHRYRQGVLDAPFSVRDVRHAIRQGGDIRHANRRGADVRHVNVQCSRRRAKKLPAQSPVFPAVRRGVAGAVSIFWRRAEALPAPFAVFSAPRRSLAGVAVSLPGAVPRRFRRRFQFVTSVTPPAKEVTFVTPTLSLRRHAEALPAPFSVFPAPRRGVAGAVFSS